MPGTRDIGSMCLQCCEHRNREPAVRTFLLKNIEQDGGPGACFGVAIEINHIVEIARSRPVAKGTELFGKRFLVGIAEDSDPVRRRIAVVVKDVAFGRRQDE